MNNFSPELFTKNDDSRREFCNWLKISEDTWKSAGADWNSLVDIASDHNSNYSSLAANAAMYAGIIQGISGVHSVRWRVKDPSHLIEKIIRKKIEGKDQYNEISIENYFQVVTDLVGIRALHLFKDDFESVHEGLLPLFADKETPVANIREGDNEEFSQLCRNLGFTVRQHPAGYRSIHYVKTVKPFNRDLHMEIQVRTVFEEGWSEVDHQVRYPNFSKDPLVAYASLILNRLSGMADEMSSYAKQLVVELEDKSASLIKYQGERDAALEMIEKLAAEVNESRQDKESQERSYLKLKEELERLKTAAISLNVFGDSTRTYSFSEGLGISPNDSVNLRNFRGRSLVIGSPDKGTKEE